MTPRSLLFVILLFANSTFAQKAIMDIHAMFVNSTSGEIYEKPSTFGGGIGYDFYLNSNLSLGLEGDYLGFKFEGGDSVVNIIPVQALIGGHWNVTDNFDVYAGTGIGFFWQRYKNGFSLAASELEWGMSPRIGLNYEFAENIFLNSTLKYTTSFGPEPKSDAHGILMFCIGLGYNINAEL